jgi:FkbM family methyltransferase
MSFMLSMKRRVHRTLTARLGLDIRRIREPVPTGHYHVSPTCQIPSLSFLYELFFPTSGTGTFVEVGAFDGYTFSNTSCLVDAGWSGHYIEPIPSSFALCRDRYATNDRVRVHNIAVGADERRIQMHAGGALSTASADSAEEYRRVHWTASAFHAGETVEADQLPLDQFLEAQSVPAGFELLVVDVEGYEASVFAGFSLDRWRPKMLIVELADTHPDFASHRREHAALSREIQRSYTIVYKDSANTMFVSEDLLLHAFVNP